MLALKLKLTLFDYFCIPLQRWESKQQTWEGDVIGHCEGAYDRHHCLAQIKKNLREKLRTSAPKPVLSYGASKKEQRKCEKP